MVVKDECQAYLKNIGHSAVVDVLKGNSEAKTHDALNNQVLAVAAIISIRGWNFHSKIEFLWLTTLRNR